MGLYSRTRQQQLVNFRRVISDVYEGRLFVSGAAAACDLEVINLCTKATRAVVLYLAAERAVLLGQAVCFPATAEVSSSSSNTGACRS